MSSPIVYWGGDFVPKAGVRISPDDRGFLLGDGVYDVVRVIEGRLFRATDHVDRLRRGAAALQIDIGDVDFFEVAEALLERNALTHGQATVYMQVTRGAAPRTHAFPRPAARPSIYVTAQAFEPRRRWLDEGIRVVTVPDVRWDRCDLKTICLLPNVLAAEQAAQAGADEALFVRDDVVLEGAHTSFCAVLGGELVTAPLSNQILPGITRRVVLELARELGLPYREEPITTTQLSELSEAFVIGTTTDITPVISVDGRPVGSGAPGRVGRELQEALTGAFAQVSP